MPFLDSKPTMLTALSRVPQQGAVNQAAVREFIETLDKELSDAFSLAFSPSGGSIYIYVIGGETGAVVRFVIAFQAPDVPAGTCSFSIQMKSPSTHTWVNKVTYSQT
jgi:hypothetical protein